MKFRYSRVPLQHLAVSAVFIIAAIVVCYVCRDFQQTPYYNQQLEAAQFMRQCMDSLATLSDRYANELDPNHTNLIGVEYSPITTTLGDLKAKRTSTNSDFAALMVRWLNELKLNQGDVVAIGCSGSFPGLILAAICAVEVMQLQPIIIPSLGASSYGANRSDFTYIDIETFLFQKNLIRYRSAAASLGGAGDTASDLSTEGRELLLKAIQHNKIKLINETNLKKNVQLRAAIYKKNGRPKVFINIGGAQINIGDYRYEKRLAPALNYFSSGSVQNPTSMIEYYSNLGVPIIHLLKIEHIALQYNLAFDPIPLPEPGKSLVYFDVVFPFYGWFISILLIGLGCLRLVWDRIR